jgi:3-deoxy-D-manno-octulosonic-acid transferase/heptosyltransferase-1
MKQRRKRILIIKLSAIGDVVHTIPFLEVVRNHFRDYRIDWLVEEEAAKIIEGHEALDRLIISFRKSWQKRAMKGRERWKVPGEMFSFLRQLRSVEYDIIIDLQGLFKSGLLAGISKGKRKIASTGGREGSAFFLTETPHPVDFNRHALERYLQLAESLGCKTNDWKGEIPIRETDKTAVKRMLKENAVRISRLIAVNPMARWETKLWDPEKFSRLSDRLIKESSCDIIFTGSQKDRRVIDGMMASMDEKALNLSGLTNLKELAYLYSKSRLLISTDTGPMHMAAAMGCPVVALFGPTAPRRTGPYGNGHRVIRSGESCSPCFKKRCDHPKCMVNITVEKVFSAVNDLLSGPERFYGNQ